MRLFLSLITAVLLLGSLAAQEPPQQSKKILNAQSWAGQLVAELEYLRAGLRSARGAEGRELATRAEQLAKEGGNLYRHLDPARRPDELMREYQHFDSGLHDFTNDLRRTLPKEIQLIRAAGRADYAGHQMAEALLPPKPEPAQRSAQIDRLAHAIDEQANLLWQIAASDPAVNRSAGRLEEDIRGLANAGDRLHQAVENNAAPNQLEQEFAALKQWWEAVAADLGQLNLAQHASVRAQAARVEQIYTALAGHFGQQVQPGIDFNNRGKIPVIAFGAGAGGGPHVKVFQDLTGQEAQSFYAYDPRFLGGVRVAVGDVNGDGVPDVVTAPGPGHPPLVRAFSGKDQTLLGQFMAYDQPYDKGVFVAVADLNRDGRANIVTGTDTGAPPHVKVFRGLNGKEVQSFWAYNQDFLGGVHVAVGDINGDGYPDVVTAPGPGMAAAVRIWSGKDWQKIGEFNAYDPQFTRGAFVAIADMHAESGRDYIVTGADAGGGPHVRVLRGLRGKEVHSLFAYDPNFPGGVRVAARDVDGDGIPDIITAPGFGSPSVIRVFSGKDASKLYEFDAYPGSKAGAFVAAH